MARLFHRSSLSRCLFYCSLYPFPMASGFVYGLRMQPGKGPQLEDVWLKGADKQKFTGTRLSTDTHIKLILLQTRKHIYHYFQTTVCRKSQPQRNAKAKPPLSNRPHLLTCSHRRLQMYQSVNSQYAFPSNCNIVKNSSEAKCHPIQPCLAS